MFTVYVIIYNPPPPPPPPPLPPLLFPSVYDPYSMYHGDRSICHHRSPPIDLKSITGTSSVLLECVEELSTCVCRYNINIYLYIPVYTCISPVYYLYIPVYTCICTCIRKVDGMNRSITSTYTCLYT